MSCIVAQPSGAALCSRLCCQHDNLTTCSPQAFLPLLGTDASLKGPKGKVVNITSVGGKYGAPFMGAYAASKHAVEGLSDSLRRELMLYGIDVIVVGAQFRLYYYPWRGTCHVQLMAFRC